MKIKLPWASGHQQGSASGFWCVIESVDVNSCQPFIIHLLLPLREVALLLTSRLLFHPGPSVFLSPSLLAFSFCCAAKDHFWVTSTTLCPPYRLWAVQLCHFVLRICTPLPRDHKVPWHSLTLEGDDWMFQFLSSVCALLSDQCDVPPGPCQPWRSHIEEIRLSLTKLLWISSEKEIPALLLLLAQL